MKRWTGDIAALLMRLAVGLIFIPHGYGKIFGKGGVASFAADLPSFHIPAFLGYIAAYAEFFGAILLVAGLLTRLDAFLLACTMAVAVAVVQLPDAINGAEPGANLFFEAMKAIELPFSLFAMCAALALTGGGRFSIDAAVFTKRAAAAAGVAAPVTTT